MCRYAEHVYKMPFACFACRKVFKQPSYWDLSPAQRPAPGQPRTIPCPQCRRPMHAMGHDFRAPRQRDIAQWAKVAVLFRHGITYHSCGCNGPGPRPATLREVPAFLAEHLPQSPGARLLAQWQPSAKRPQRRSRGGGSRLHAR